MDNRVKSILLVLILITLFLPATVRGETLCGVLDVIGNYDSDSNSVVLEVSAGMPVTHRYYSVSRTDYRHLKALEGGIVLLKYHVTYNPFRFHYDSATRYEYVPGKDPKSILP